MAVDTADRRASAMLPLLPFRGRLPLPEGSVTGNDRPQVLFLYRVSAEVVSILTDPAFLIYALDRDESLFALQGLDATETLMALARDESLFPLQCDDGIETLRALDRDESLKPLEART